MGQTWVRHCPITNKYWCQGCALRKIVGSPVLWTCEILGAQHIISIEKVTFSSRPGANLVAKGYRTLLVLTALYLLQIWLMLNKYYFCLLICVQKIKNFHCKRVESISVVGVWVCFSGTKQNIIPLVNIKSYITLLVTSLCLTPSSISLTK